jgi:hypothetical protein
VLLAEIEVWHNRPLTPTRRVALGHLVLPVDPPPGFGGLLLGAVVAAHLPLVADDLVPDIHRLVNEIDEGRRIVQPRLRHRYQVDRHGLARSTHRLIGHGEDISFEMEQHGHPLQQVLGAVYAVERLGPEARHSVTGVLHKALRWRGPIGPSLVAYLAGLGPGHVASLVAMADPVAWALDVLGFPPGTTTPKRKDVQARFRLRLREEHPDHGATDHGAGKRIEDLAEARRILLR